MSIDADELNDPGVEDGDGFDPDVEPGFEEDDDGWGPWEDDDEPDLDDDDGWAGVEGGEPVDAEVVDDHHPGRHPGRHGGDSDHGEAGLATPGGGVVATYGPAAGRAVAESPLTLGMWLHRQVGVTVRGATFLARTWHSWVKVEEDRRTLDARSRMAGRQDMVITEGDRKSARDTEARRGQRSASLVVLALLGLLAGSASWSWQWPSFTLLAVGVVIAGDRRHTKPWGPWVGLPMVLAAPALAITHVAWEPAAATATGAVLLCWVIGRKVTDPDTGIYVPDITLGPSTSAGSLEKVVDDVLRSQKPPITGWRMISSRRTPHALVLDTNLIGDLEDRHLRALERAVGAGWGRITSVPDPENSAHRIMTFRWRDPLSRFPALPDRAAGSIDATRPIALGVDEDNDVVAATLAGRHVLIDGVTGSGKSGLVLNILDALCSAWNAEVDAIDLSGGPETEAVEPNLRSPLAGGDDVETAERILDDALAEIRRRLDILRDGVRRRERGQPIDRAWTCTAADPARFVVIDEFPLLAEHPRLLAKVNRIMRIGRKARVTLVIITQDPTRQAMAGTVVTRGAGVRIGLAMPGDHIRHVFGDGSAALGFRPDLLAPSDDAAGLVNDAGKFYLRAGGTRTPALARAFGLDLDVAADRALDRAEAAAGRQVGAAVAVDTAVEVPQILADLERAMGDGEFLPTERALEATGHKSARALAIALKRHGMEPGKEPGGGSNAPRGYTRSSLVSALEGLS